MVLRYYSIESEIAKRESCKIKMRKSKSGEIETMESHTVITNMTVNSNVNKVKRSRRKTILKVRAAGIKPRVRMISAGGVAYQ